MPKPPDSRGREEYDTSHIAIIAWLLVAGDRGRFVVTTSVVKTAEAVTTNPGWLLVAGGRFLVTGATALSVVKTAKALEAIAGYYRPWLLVVGRWSLVANRWLAQLFRPNRIKAIGC
jgi:hypothetical protein